MKAGEACEVCFSWDHLYNEKEISFSDIRFEQLNILYNIGALHSNLGCLDKRMNDDVKNEKKASNSCFYF
jgi:tyrosine-protein phosphatase non-receptor type 23